jgi:hypothetical protein
MGCSWPYGAASHSVNLPRAGRNLKGVSCGSEVPARRQRLVPRGQSRISKPIDAADPARRRALAIETYIDLDPGGLFRALRHPMP